MKLSLKKISVLISLLYLLTGVYLAVNSGISHDEFHEQQNWVINLNAIKSFITDRNYEDLLNYKDKYHGIGFHYLSQPFQFLFYKQVSNYLSVTEYGGILISKHIFTFLIFTVSGLFLYLILKQLIKDKYFVLISVLIYLLYPYLFGHAQFNPKIFHFCLYGLFVLILLLK